MLHLTLRYQYANTSYILRRNICEALNYINTLRRFSRWIQIRSHGERWLVRGGGNVRICAIEQSDFKTQYRSKWNEMRIEGYSCQLGRGWKWSGAGTRLRSG